MVLNIIDQTEGLVLGVNLELAVLCSAMTFLLLLRQNVAAMLGSLRDKLKQ